MTSEIRIELTKGHFTVMDREDGYLAEGRSLSVNGQGYAQGWVGGKVVRIHRVIAGASPGEIVDHIDGDRLNNRRSNLRIVTREQNQINCKGRGAKSGYRGVYACRSKWQAKIGNHFIGTYDNPVDAALARDDRMRSLFGDFGRYNFPRNGERPA